MKTIQTSNGESVTLYEMSDKSGNKVVVAEYNKNHDAKGRFAPGSGGGSGSGDSSKPVIGGSPTLEEAMAVIDEYELSMNASETSNLASGDVGLGRIQKKLGLDGKPTVVSKAEFRKQLDADNPNMYRGFEKKSFLKQYKDGDLHPGNGLFGSGTYASEDRNIAKKYSADGSIMRLTIKGAKIADYNVLSREANQQSSRLISEAAKAGNDAAAVKVSSLYTNLGRYAALRGYDMMVVPSPFGDSQFVILNRGKVIIEGDK